MSKLYFRYGAMNSGKSTALLQAAFNYEERGQYVLLAEVAVLDRVPVLAYGIRTDFQTKAFPGSRRLLEIAHSLEELKTICRCGKKAMFNGRLVNGRFVFSGEQVAIDGDKVTYESLCPACYLAKKPG